MKVLVLGANGKVGSRVVVELLKRGHTVVAGVHKNKDRVPKGAELVTLNIANQSSIEKGLQGCDAVVCALSSWHAPAHNVLGQTMHVLIPAMRQAKVRRIVSISGDVARVPNETPGLLTRIFHVFAFGIVGKVVRDSEEHLRLLYESDLEWTVFRPGLMTSSQSMAYRLCAKHPRSMFVTRNAVVAAIADELEVPTHVGEAPFICNS